MLISDSIDPCSSYEAINEWQRSVRNNKVETAKCDSFLKEGWYRVTSQAGEEMPTSCPKNGFRCGTIEPVWLNGIYNTSKMPNQFYNLAMEKLPRKTLFEKRVYSVVSDCKI